MREPPWASDPNQPWISPNPQEFFCSFCGCFLGTGIEQGMDRGRSMQKSHNGPCGNVCEGWLLAQSVDRMREAMEKGEDPELLPRTDIQQKCHTMGCGCGRK